MIPVDALRTLIDEPIDDVATAAPDYPPVAVPEGLLTRLNHRAACRALLLWISGASSVRAIRARARLPGGAPR